MHSAFLFRSTLLAILPFFSQARQAGLASTNTAASGISIGPSSSLSSSASSSNNPVSATASVSSAVSLNDLLTQLVNAEQQALIATHYLANLKEKAVALAQAQGLAKPKSVADKAGSAHQIRQASLPEKQATCDLLHADKSRVVALRKAFTYNAIVKGSKDSAGALINSAIAVYTTLQADIATAKKAPYVYFEISNGDLTTTQSQLLSADSAARFALGSLQALAIDNQKRKSAFAVFFTGATVFDFFKFSAVGNANNRVIYALETFGTYYNCGKGY